jgi:hypothetical protein
MNKGIVLGCLRNQWQEYLVADPPLRKTIEKVLRVQLARELGETFDSEQVLLKPPSPHISSVFSVF